MSIAEEVRRLEEENARLRAALKQVINSIQGAADALAGEEPPPAAENDTPVSLPPRQQAEQTPMAEQELVDTKGAPDGAYRVDAASVLEGRML